MANQVYANGREIACKAANGKSICAFPDVCFTPPQTPGTPPGVPIPYPNTGFAKDTTSGSRTVKISGKEVMLKNKSCFKKSTGDEAGSAPKKGFLTSTNRGKVYFNAWSMDVKIEGENVVRHLDLTTHNHMSVPGDTPTWPYLDSSDAAANAACAGDKKKERDACEPLEVKFKSGGVKVGETQDAQCASTPEAEKCQQARKCMLTPYHPDRCCSGQTGHHLVEVHGFCQPGDRDTPVSPFNGDGGKRAYSQYHAPCVCAASPNSNWEAEHGDLHSVQGIKENYAILTAASRQPPRSPDMAWTYGEARTAGVDAHAATFPNSGCSEACIKAQLDAYHEQVGAQESTPLRTEKYGFGDPIKGDAKVDQLRRGQELIKNLAEKRIGQIVGGIWKF
jgi:Domain of unknown function (DUF4150)/GHH signature containing HNH/Endo VII superfamily nuclease toxin  2